MGIKKYFKIDNAIKAKKEKRNMLNYSFHTYELYANLEVKEYIEIYHTLKEGNPSIEKKSYNSKTHLTKTVYTIRKIHMPGINTIKLTSIILDNNITLQCNLYVIINPLNALLSCNESNEKIIDSLHVKTALQIVDQYLSNLLPPTILNKLSLSRIDFCVNLPFSTQCEATEYISLLRLGIPQKVLKEELRLDKHQHRFLPYNDALLLTCGTYSLEIYSKYIQMKKRNINGADRALGLVRVELRATKPKIQQLANKYQLPSPIDNYNFFLQHAPIITKQEIPYMLTKMVGSKDFHRFQYAKDKISRSDYKPAEKKLMIDIITYFSRRKYSYNMLNTFNITQKDWQKIVHKFNQIDCSPITVSPCFSSDTFPGIESWNTYFK